MAKKRKKHSNPAGVASFSKPMSIVKGAVSKDALKASLATVGGLAGTAFIAGKIAGMAKITNPWAVAGITFVSAGIVSALSHMVVKGQSKFVLAGGGAVAVAKTINAVSPGAMAAIGISGDDGLDDYVDPRQIINARVGISGTDDYADLPQVQNARQLDGIDCVNEMISSEELSSQV